MKMNKMIVPLMLIVSGCTTALQAATEPFILVWGDNKTNTVQISKNVMRGCHSSKITGSRGVINMIKNDTKESEQNRATFKNFLTNEFTGEGMFCVFAHNNHNMVGAAIANKEHKVFTYVKSTYRKKGLGTKLSTKLLHHILKHHGKKPFFTLPKGLTKQAKRTAQQFTEKMMTEVIFS